MKRFLAMAVAMFLLSTSNVLAEFMGNVFTYQGELSHLGQPANGIYHFEVTLWNAEVDGDPLDGSPVSVFDNVQVIDGVFSLEIDLFDYQLQGQAVWLQIQVTVADEQEWVELVPRQRLTPAPYALVAQRVVNLSGEHCDNQTYLAGFDAKNRLICKPMIGLSCGNSRVDHAFGERCDDGNTIDGDGCSAECMWEPLRVFLSSAVYPNGDLGGHAGADAKCQALADDAGLGGEFKAWISSCIYDGGYTCNQPATDWNTGSLRPLERMDGVQVAESLSALMSIGGLEEPINITETSGSGVIGWAFTGTNEFGYDPRSLIPDLPEGNSWCSEWTSNASDESLLKGDWNATESAWTTDGNVPCNVPGHLYCFEQDTQ